MTKTYDRIVNSHKKETQGLMKTQRKAGKKEGKGIIYSEKNLIYAIVNYHNDSLSGKCVFFNEFGEKEKMAYFF